MDQDSRVRQRHPLSFRAAGEKQRSHAHRDADADRLHVRLDELHRVVDRETGIHRAARRVDVEEDVLVRIVRLQMQELGDHEVRDLVVHGGPEEDDALGEQARVDVEGALAARGLLDHHRDQRAHRFSPSTRSSCRGSTISSLSRAPSSLPGVQMLSRAVRQLLRDRRHLGGDPIDRPPEPEVRADAVGAARGHELLDVLVALALLLQVGADLVVGHLDVELVGDALEHELAADRMRGLRAEPLLELGAADARRLEVRRPDRSRCASSCRMNALIRSRVRISTTRRAG